MILGTGIDLVELARVERLYEEHGETFVRRFCLPDEEADRHGVAAVEHLGGLFAAKEAVLKALGTGWAQGVGLKHVEIERQASGAPRVRLHRAAAERAADLGVEAIHVSISHERRYAVAMAVLEGSGNGG